MAKGTLQPDGTRCYAGPDCKIHGQHNKADALVSRINGIFTREEKHKLNFTGSLEEIKDSYAKEYSKLLNKVGEEPQEMALYARLNYNDINHVLRRRVEHPDWPFFGNGEKTVKKMDKYLAQNKVPVAGVLYRGVSFNEPQNFEVGQEVSDAAYLSTSSNPKVAMYVASKRENDTNGVIFRLNVKEATPMNEQEQEYLLERGKKFKVAAVRKNASFKSSRHNKKVVVTIVDLEEV